MEQLLNSIQSFSWLFELLFVIFTGLVTYIMNSLSTRISALEEDKERLIQEKLDKVDYHRDKAATDNVLKEMRDDIRVLGNNITNLPHKIVELFSHLKQ